MTAFDPKRIFKVKYFPGRRGNEGAFVHRKAIIYLRMNLLNPIVRFVVAATTLLVAAHAHGADDLRTVSRPEVQVGDRWTYRRIELGINTEDLTYEERVTLVTPTSIFAVVTGKKDEEELDVHFTREWNAVMAVNGQFFRPHHGLLRFPLIVGSNYPLNYEMAARRDSSKRVIHKGQINVIGWEDVTVPAGTFHALKVEARTFYQRLDRRGQGRARFQIWYVPEVRRSVKTAYDDDSQKISSELVAFNLQASVPSTGDGDLSRMPDVRVGDHWTYRRIDYWTNQPLYTYAMRVTKVGAGTISVTSKRDDGQTESDSTWTSEWNATSANGTLFSPPPRLLRFPMKIGATHQTAYSIAASTETPISYSSDEKVTVVGWEDIVVPAGKFHALRVEAEGVIDIADPVKIELRSAKSTKGGLIKQVFWYAPLVERWVLHTCQIRNIEGIIDEWGEELMETSIK